MVIELDGEEEETFQSYPSDQLSSLTADQVQENLVNSGLWTTLRTRPFSRTPALGSRPQAIFVNAMDTNPLAANPEVIIAEQADAYKSGLQVLKKLTEGKLYVCNAPGANIPRAGVENTEEFSGPHPAGLAGTHIHFLHPVSQERVVWTVGYQDVIAIGHLFTTGKLSTER